jgi:hypothetical protein
MTPTAPRCRLRGVLAPIAAALTITIAAAPTARAADEIYFTSRDDVMTRLIQRINAETVRIDMAIWLLTERSISIALVNRFKAGVPVRLLGDRVSIFESDRFTKQEFYWIASQGVPIRLRSHPTWYPEINHWKATIFVGQNVVSFGSGNYTPFELRPASATNYKDESVMFTDDPAIVNAFKTKFDRMWNDTATEPRSRIVNPPFMRNWYTACAAEPACADFSTQYPNPAPMSINTARLEPDYPLPADIVWGQGSEFNTRLVQEINNERLRPAGSNRRIDATIFRLTVASVADAMIAAHNAGATVRYIVDPEQYEQRLWPEYELTHANIDRMWAAGIPIRQRVHDGLTHMKMLVTSNVALNGSSNVAPAWQRDHNYFIPVSAKPAIYQAMADEFDRMWDNPSAFGPFTPEPADIAALSSPAAGATGISTTGALRWNRASFAVSYDVYLGTSSSNMTLVGNVPAVLTPTPPTTYQWIPPTPLQGGTTYFWRVVSRTYATDVNPALIATSSTRSFTTAGSPSGPPPAPSNPSPTSGSTGVATSPTLGWTGTSGATYAIAFGTANPPPTVVANQSATTYAPGTLSQGTTYFWRITATTTGGSTAGPVWSFTTASGSAPAGEIVIYANDVTTLSGIWSKVSDATAAAGIKLRTPDNGAAPLSTPLANPSSYFETSFEAQAGTRYRVWLRIRANSDSKWNDSVFVQFSDSVNTSGNPIYRIGTTGGYVVNLWTCAECQSIGWGWQRSAYYVEDTGDVRFAATGTHTIRVQVREDGVEIDQIVISPSTYANSAPGPVSGDTTIVPKPGSPPPPPAPGTPATPSPANNATNVSVSTTLSWSSTNATSYDVRFGTANPPPTVSTNQSGATYVAPTLSASTAYFWQIVARNASGTTTGPVWTFTTTAGPPPPSIAEVVVYASDVPDGNLHGGWAKAADSSSPNGVKLITPNAEAAALAAPLANPTHYVDIPFEASAGTQYRLWIRLRAADNSKWNDSVFVQFSDARSSGSPIYALNSTSGLLVNLATDSGASSLNGWGWHNGAYWMSQPTLLTFASSGTHTMRVQVREDGVQLDQVVLSSVTYRNSAPGPVGGDSTIVPKP